MAVKDTYGQDVNIGDYVITTPPHYRDSPFLTKVKSIGRVAITVEYLKDGQTLRSVRSGFIKISNEEAERIIGELF